MTSLAEKETQLFFLEECFTRVPSPRGQEVWVSSGACPELDEGISAQHERVFLLNGFRADKHPLTLSISKCVVSVLRPFVKLRTIEYA
jgi:hypothetical protein